MSQKSSKPVTVAATQAHRQFGELIRRAFLGEEHFVIEKGGLPVAVILSAAEHAELMHGRERQEQVKQEQLSQFRDAARAIGTEFEKMELSDEQMVNLLHETLYHVYQKRSAQTSS